MAIKYPVLLTPLVLTNNVNDDIEITDSTSTKKTVSLTTATSGSNPTNLPDWLVTGNGDSPRYDLFQNLADAMTAADAGGNYTAVYTTGSDGITGKMLITETGAQNFSIHWTDANTTIDPEWFGFFSDSADSAGASNYTSPGSSVLGWFPLVPASTRTFEPDAHSVVFSEMSTDMSRMVTNRVALLRQSDHLRTFLEMQDILYDRPAKFRSGDDRPRYTLSYP